MSQLSCGPDGEYAERMQDASSRWQRFSDEQKQAYEAKAVSHTAAKRQLMTTPLPTAFKKHQIELTEGLGKMSLSKVSLARLRANERAATQHPAWGQRLNGFSIVDAELPAALRAEHINTALSDDVIETLVSDLMETALPAAQPASSSNAHGKAVHHDVCHTLYGQCRDLVDVKPLKKLVSRMNTLITKEKFLNRGDLLKFVTEDAGNIELWFLADFLQRPQVQILVGAEPKLDISGDGIITEAAITLALDEDQKPIVCTSAELFSRLLRDGPLVFQVLQYTCTCPDDMGTEIRQVWVQSASELIVLALTKARQERRPRTFRLPFGLEMPKRPTTHKPRKPRRRRSQAAAAEPGEPREQPADQGSVSSEASPSGASDASFSRDSSEAVCHSVCFLVSLCLSFCLRFRMNRLRMHRLRSRRLPPGRQPLVWDLSDLRSI